MVGAQHGVLCWCALTHHTTEGGRKEGGEGRKEGRKEGGTEGGSVAAIVTTVRLFGMWSDY